MSYRVVGVAFAAGFFVGANPAVPLAQQSPSVTRTELQRVELKDVPGKEGITFVADFPPGAISPRHSHPGPEFIYILEGTFVIEADGRAPITLKKGETAFEQAGQVHSGKNSTSEPVKVLVFMVADKGKPLTIPAPPSQ